MRKILDYLDLVGRIYDESVGINIPNEGDPPYPFTIEEFENFVDKIWEDAGGWDNCDKYCVEDAYFETYSVPFEDSGKKYYLSIMSGQGQSWTLFNETENAEFEKRCSELNKQMKEEGDDFMKFLC